MNPKWNGALIEKQRVAAKLTPTQLAARAGVTAETLRSWEKGDTAPDGREIARLANALGVSPQAFYANEKAEPAKAR